MTATSNLIARVAPRSNGDPLPISRRNGYSFPTNGSPFRTLKLQLAVPNSENIWPVNYESGKEYLEAKIKAIAFNRTTPDRRQIAGDLCEKLDWLQSIDLESSSDYILKLAQIVKATENRKELIETLSFEKGGATSIFPGIGAAELFWMISELHDISHTFNKFSGSSAGAILAACMAGRVPASELCKICDLDFTNLPKHPELLMQWVNDKLLIGYNRTTGKDFNGWITASHLKELGTKLYIPIGIEGSKLLGGYPQKKVFFLPDTLDGSNPNIEDIPIAWIVAASCNLRPLFGYSNCFLFKHPELTNNKEVYVVDPGVRPENSLPLDIEMQALLKGRMGFSVGSTKSRTNLETFTFGKNPSLPKRWVAASYDIACDGMNSLFNNNTIQRIQRLGTSFLHVQTTNKTYDPSKGKKIEVMTGTFAPPDDLRKLAHANFLLSIDQLHEHLVDNRYLESRGTSGSNAFEIWNNEVKNASGKRAAKRYLEERGLHNNSSRASLIARLSTRARNTLRSAATF